MLFLCIFLPESPALKSPGEKQKCRLSPRYTWPLGCRPAGVSSVASPMPGGFRVPVRHGVDGANVGRGLGSSLGVLSDPLIMFASLAFNPGSPGRRKHLSRALAQRRWRWRGLHSISLKPLLPKQKKITLSGVGSRSRHLGSKMCVVWLLFFLGWRSAHLPRCTRPCASARRDVFASVLGEQGVNCSGTGSRRARIVAIVPRTPLSPL